MQKRKTVQSIVESYLSRRKTPATTEQIINGVTGMNKSRNIPRESVRRNLSRLVNGGRAVNVNPGTRTAQYVLR